MDDQLNSLKSKKRVIKSSLTRFKTFFESVKDNIDEASINQLRLRMEKVEPLWENFNEVQTSIEVLESEDIDETERENFENIYFSLVGDAKLVIQKFESQIAQSIRSEGSRSASQNSYPVLYSAGVGITSSIKLPPIKLPNFNGQYDSWLEFKNSFAALVNNNESLSDIQKFIYLKSCLEKHVLEIIKEIEVTADNYETVWQLLVDRFENKKLIVHNHIKSIFEYPTVAKESHTELRNLYDNIQKHLRALKGLGEVTDTWDRLIIYIISNKFDPVTKRDWEEYKIKGELPSMEDLSAFLKSRCELLEMLKVTRNERVRITPASHKKFSNSYASVSKNYSCNFCGSPHSIYKCNSFLRLSGPERCAAVKNKKLCSKCLLSHYSAKDCKARGCSKCHGAHSSLLHVDSMQSSQVSESVETPTENNAGASITVNNHISNLKQNKESSMVQVLLATAIVKISNGQNSILVRALLDSGSQSNFITEDCCEKLKLKGINLKHVIKGVGQVVTNVSRQVEVTLNSTVNKYEEKMKCLVLPNITEKLPTVSFKRQLLNIPQGLELADPYFNKPEKIDILLGSSIFWNVIKKDREFLGKNLPVMQDSQLGWIIAGNLQVNSSVNNFSVTCFNRVSLVNRLDTNLLKFWQLEDVDCQESILSKEEYFCEKYFDETTKRDENGRFVVRLPFKKPLGELGNSQEVAARRFMLLERRLTKNPELKSEYCAFMSEYESLNHMVKISNNLEQSGGYFMPHHAVIKSSSLTTKCRVVFDASAKTSTNVSLNDILAVGPKLQQDIFDILIRFRKHNIVMTADISKMYRQVLVSEEDTKYQRILWRQNPSEPLSCYELKTVTYGTGSAPHLAVKCLFSLAKENEREYPLISKIICQDFYMDDVLSGADTVEQALFIQKQLSRILSSAGFHLRKWLSNNKAVLTNLDIEPEIEAGILSIGPNEQNKTLGIFWNAFDDVIQYRISGYDCNKNVTKRQVLSIICQIFDPLGLAGPIIVVAKLMMQELWKLKIDWDAIVPQEFETKWLSFLRQLPTLNEFKIPRHILNIKYVSVELHGFSDASLRAFGACLYLKWLGSSGQKAVRLICSKSRVAPLKQVSLPRLELCGALLLAKLAKRVASALDLEFSKKTFWTDSTITLAWIRAEPARWKTFVGNRVSKIQGLTDIKEWNHVKSEENPADLLSRGTPPAELKNNSLWWNGPQFLLDNSGEHDEYYLSEYEIPEMRVTAASVSVAPSNLVSNLLNKFSNINKVVRVLAYVLRFGKNIKLTKNERVIGSLTLIELEIALNLVIENVQRECFPEDYKQLQNKGTVKNKSKILCLNPFLKDRLIRVGGRIVNSNESYDKVHPIILPKNHILTDLILRNEHERLLHVGTQSLLASIRDIYWPISGRSSCKKIVKNCIKCFKVKPKDTSYLMGNLPEMRVKDYLPFYNVGTDFGGPFLVKNKRGRGSKNYKAYVCLFVCMSTKAVHLELVSELTTDAFLATLNRFISRRGKPSSILSDNALNFVGANNELVNIFNFLEQNNEKIVEKLAAERITWKFIPARSPNFGGIWEAGIKNCKFHLKRVVGNASLTFEEFNTVLCKIEAVLNSRPLCPLTNDPNDPVALTPAHFLIGRSLTALPERDVTCVPEGRLSSWQRLQAVTQHFWARWHKEYLAELQTRIKWRQRAPELLKEGALVLLKEDNSPPMNWHLGRVVQTHPGSDGVVRVASVKVRGTVVKRAINRLCVLPLDEDM